MTITISNYPHFTFWVFPHISGMVVYAGRPHQVLALGRQPAPKWAWSGYTPNKRGPSNLTHFWATVCTTVRPMLSDRCLSVCLSVCLSALTVLSVCDDGVLWPNGWMDQDEAWHAGRPRPQPHCVRWGPSSPSLNGTAPNFRSVSVVAKWLDGLRCHLV